MRKGFLLLLMLQGCCQLGFADKFIVTEHASRSGGFVVDERVVHEPKQDVKPPVENEQKSDKEIEVPKVVHDPPRITFRAGSTDGLQRTTSSKQESWLVSEDWCVNCPSAKVKFVSSGGRPDHIITIAEAKRRHGKVIAGVPVEYTTTEIVEYIQPPTYRLVNVMTWAYNGDPKPPRETILRHLREDPNHKGKHWQAWHLEAWRTPQLYALHDDDHDHKVPEFKVAPEAVVENTELTPDVVAEVLAEHLAMSQGMGNADPVYGSLINLDVTTPASVLDVIHQVLTTHKFELAGGTITGEWQGDTRNVNFVNGVISFSPGVKCTAKKYGVRIGATLNKVTYPADLQSVTLVLSGAPDITIRLHPKQSSEVIVSPGDGKKPVILKRTDNPNRFDFSEKVLVP